MKIILNIGTHGDEKIGGLVIKELSKLKTSENIFTVQIANEKAYKLNKRFIDQDLNRSFPGKKSGNHEEKLAYMLSPIIKSADIVIDLHSTTSELKDALIVTKLNRKTKEYIKVIQPRNVLIMKATKSTALISQAKVGIAFEYGKDMDPLVVKKISLGILSLFNHLGLIKIKTPKAKFKSRYFSVNSAVKKPRGYKLLNKIRNYKLIKKGETYAVYGNKKLVAGEDFYPILFGQKNYEDIFGFKGQKLSESML
ncbi:MAG: succinylglutamate desuccinylase/aspartoacylase family protein [Candidatus Paceibacterota bacterium]